MRKSALFLVFVLSLFFQASGQPPPPPPSSAPPPAVSRSTAASEAKLTPAQLEAKVAQSVAKPIAWKKYALKGFDVSVDLPRDPIAQEESFYEEGFGNVRLDLQMSVGDGVIFMVGRMALPYALTDEKLLRETYTALAKGIEEESQSKFGAPIDFRFNGNLGVELTAPAADPRFPPLSFRGLVLGRAVYMLVVMPTSAPAEDEPPSKAELSRIQAETARFFNSVAVVQQPPPPPRKVGPPMFASAYDGKVFRSEYFSFNFTPPAGWLKVSEDDVEGIRKAGKEIVTASTGKDLPTPKARQNLATFVSKPLGNEGVAMIAVNLGVKGTSVSDAEDMAKTAEEVLSKLPIYQIRKKPELTKIGGQPAYTMETTVKLSEMTQKQAVYFFQRRDYVLAITVTYFDDADKQRAVSAVEGIVFSAAADTPK